MKKIKNIVVAVDFSVTARNAYSYAGLLAKNLHASLSVVHIKENLIMLSDVTVASLPPIDNEELIDDLKKLMSEENAADPNLTIPEPEIKILKGKPEDVLIRLSDEVGTDLIVIGTTGLADSLTKIFGSTSINVSNRAHCPVIVVPRDTKWQPIRQILFASTSDSVSPEMVGQINDLALDLGAGIHFVHVKDPNPLHESDQKETNWDAIKTDLAVPIEKHTIYGTDPIQELLDYCRANKIDLMAFVSKHRNFWQNLVHKSVTENVALSAVIPVLVMHEDDY